MLEAFDVGPLVLKPVGGIEAAGWDICGVILPRVSGFSYRGFTCLDCAKVDEVAPGVAVIAAAASPDSPPAGCPSVGTCGSVV